MPPLKAIEQAQFGGIDSRSNPIVMPLNRFLLCVNWRPRQDGHLELRDGYTAITPMDPDASVAGIHSICPYTVQTPAGPLGTAVPISGFSNGDICIIFWRGGNPYLRRISDGLTVNLVPYIRGNAIASSHRWLYALGKDGYLYMHNGTDAKFFDGARLRDIGLPTLSGAQLAGITVREGFHSPNPTTVAAAVLTWSASGTFHPLSQIYKFYYTAFNISDNSLAACGTPIGGDYAPVGASDLSKLVITGLPTVADTNVRGLVAFNENNSAGATFVNVACADSTKLKLIRGTMVGTGGAGGTVTVTVTSTEAFSGPGPLNHGLSVGDVVAIDNPTFAWHSNGPFAVTAVPDVTHFQFKAPAGVDASVYTIAVSIDFQHLLTVLYSSSTVTLVNQDALTQLVYQGSGRSSDGTLQMAYVEDMASSLLPATAIGGSQPGYQFYAAIYNPLTGHVGNRTPIGLRVKNTQDCQIIISGLPNFTVMLLDRQGRAVKAMPQTSYGYGSRNIMWGARGGTAPITLPQTDSEWRVLIGRTGDGGEVPYACIDANGNWITTALGPSGASQTQITIQTGQIDGNSELPTENYPPPAFNSFWREGDRMCGAVVKQPFVFRSSSEVDATTGIFVGDPAQAWSPIRVETFPTAQEILGGFGYMQESWVFTANSLGQLSELSGEVSWNGPYNFGVIGLYAFDKGWDSLPFWISHDKQLCTMLPRSNGPISISTEYEAGRLFKIGDAYRGETELVYFRDPARMVDQLRIKCVDDTGNPFVVIHDFNLRDDASPYGQGYTEGFLGPLETDYTHAWVRDSNGHARIWAGGRDGNLYQLYSGGDDVGNYFSADAIQLRYIGGERTAVKTLEWYGDPLIQWYIYEGMLDVFPDPAFWVNLTYEGRPVPGDSGNGHFMADLQRPEMTHCYLWTSLTAHPFDAPNPADPMALNDPPHIPVEVYGRMFMTSPVLGDSRGR